MTQEQKGTRAIAVERIDWLDILRGIAVAGMLLVHVANALHGSGKTYEFWLAAFEFLAKGKFYTIFALLFGIGFAFQTEKVANGRHGAELYWRRLAGLGLIMATLQVLFGTSLFYYAIWGLPLLLLSRLSSKKLILAAIAFLCLQSATIVAVGLYRISAVGPAAAASELAATEANRRAAVQARKAGTSYTERLQAHAREFDLRRALSADNLIRFEWGAFALAVFVLGLLAVRHGVLADPGRHTDLLRRIVLGGAALATLALVLDKAWDPGFAYPAFNGVAKQGLGLFRTEWLGIAYAAALVLALSHRAASGLLRPLAVVGRAALSNYALHLLVLEILFGRWSLGLDLDWRLTVPVSLGIFGLQAALTGWWVARYGQGPLERFWRSLSYGVREARQPRAA